MDEYSIALAFLQVVLAQQREMPLATTPRRRKKVRRKQRQESVGAVNCLFDFSDELTTTLIRGKPIKELYALIGEPGGNPAGDLPILLSVT